MTIITLSNGKKVGNFSSPHPFTFEDGSVLPAVSEEKAKRLEINFIETVVDRLNGDVSLTFELSADVLAEMEKWQKIYSIEEVDVVFCPLPMITALRKSTSISTVRLTPFRAIRIEDRIKKLVSIHKQCI